MPRRGARKKREGDIFNNINYYYIHLSGMNFKWTPDRFSCLEKSGVEKFYCSKVIHTDHSCGYTRIQFEIEILENNILAMVDFINFSR